MSVVIIYRIRVNKYWRDIKEPVIKFWPWLASSVWRFQNLRIGIHHHHHHHNHRYHTTNLIQSSCLNICKCKIVKNKNEKWLLNIIDDSKDIAPAERHTAKYKINMESWNLKRNGGGAGSDFDRSSRPGSGRSETGHELLRTCNQTSMSTSSSSYSLSPSSPMENFPSRLNKSML